MAAKTIMLNKHWENQQRYLVNSETLRVLPTHTQLNLPDVITDRNKGKPCASWSPSPKTCRCFWWGRRAQRLAGWCPRPAHSRWSPRRRGTWWPGPAVAAPPPAHGRRRGDARETRWHMLLDQGSLSTGKMNHYTKTHIHKSSKPNKNKSNQSIWLNVWGCVEAAY